MQKNLCNPFYRIKNSWNYYPALLISSFSFCPRRKTKKLQNTKFFCGFEKNLWKFMIIALEYDHRKRFSNLPGMTKESLSDPAGGLVFNFQLCCLCAYPQRNELGYANSTLALIDGSSFVKSFVKFLITLRVCQLEAISVKSCVNPGLIDAVERRESKALFGA